MKSQPKEKALRSKEYLDFIRQHACINCLNPEAEPHHVRRLHFNCGVGLKPHDFVTIPLCRRCHNPKTEQKLNCFDVNLEAIIIRLLTKYFIQKKGKLSLINLLMKGIIVNDSPDIDIERRRAETQ